MTQRPSKFEFELETSKTLAFWQRTVDFLGETQEGAKLAAELRRKIERERFILANGGASLAERHWWVWEREARAAGLR